MASGPALLVEVEVDAVAGVAGVSGPDLTPVRGSRGKMVVA